VRGFMAAMRASFAGHTPLPWQKWCGVRRCCALGTNDPV
jgi:hypothetical protein